MVVRVGFEPTFGSDPQLYKNCPFPFTASIAATAQALLTVEAMLLRTGGQCNTFFFSCFDIPFDEVEVTPYVRHEQAILWHMTRPQHIAQGMVILLEQLEVFVGQRIARLQLPLGGGEFFIVCHVTAS